jgi:hypothetical protein
MKLGKDVLMAKVLSPMPAEIRAQIENMALEVAELVPEAAYANYMILDPTRPDPTGILPGAPIYVGQSGCVARRIKAHMRRALMQSVRRGSLYERIVAIVRAGAMPIFRVLQLYPTRLESVRGETIWAQRLLRDGARLYNRWPEQSRLMAGKELARRQRRRLFDLSMAEASEAGAALQARCFRDGWHVAIGAEHLLPRFGKLVTFHAVRRTLRECPQCGGRLRHAIVLEADQACIDRRAG